jgi:hypothetical protein
LSFNPKITEIFSTSLMNFAPRALADMLTYQRLLSVVYSRQGRALSLRLSPPVAAEEDRCRLELVADPAPESAEVAVDDWNFGTSKIPKKLKKILWE